MKRAIIGGFISLIGAIGVLASFVVAGNNLVSGWGTPPGRFLTTISEIGMTGPLVISCILLLMGLGIMLDEFRKSE